MKKRVSCELPRETSENLKEGLRKRYEIAEDEPLKIYQCNGYTQVQKWEEV